MAKKKPDNKQEELASAICDAINKKFKDGQVAFMMGQEETPTDLSDFISTSSSILDVAISNRANGGIACGRITELTGLEGSGKSLVAAHMMANVQKDGGVAVLIDTENAFNEDFFRSVGLDMAKMTYAPVSTVEDIFTTIETIVTKVRETENNTKKVIIVVDSVTGAPTQKEVEGDYEQAGYGTEKAKFLSFAVKKVLSLIAKQKIALVFTNQLRQKLNAPAFSDPYTTSGGLAIRFYASTRIRLSVIGKIQNAKKDVIGVTVKAVVIKNRLGPPFRTAEFNVYFDRGIDDLDSWLKFCKDRDILTTGGAYFTYTTLAGEAHKMQSKDWKPFLAANPDLKEEIYNRMIETIIMSYSSAGLTPEDVQLEEGDIDL